MREVLANLTEEEAHSVWLALVQYVENESDMFDGNDSTAWPDEAIAASNVLERLNKTLADKAEDSQLRDAKDELYRLSVKYKEEIEVVERKIRIIEYQNKHGR